MIILPVYQFVFTVGLYKYSLYLYSATQEKQVEDPTVMYGLPKEKVFFMATIKQCCCIECTFPEISLAQWPKTVSIKTKLLHWTTAAVSLT